jgi:hypothetical protein
MAGGHPRDLFAVYVLDSDDEPDVEETFEICGYVAKTFTHAAAKVPGKTTHTSPRPRSHPPLTHYAFCAAGQQRRRVVRAAQGVGGQARLAALVTAGDAAHPGWSWSIPPIGIPSLWGTTSAFVATTARLRWDNRLDQVEELVAEMEEMYLRNPSDASQFLENFATYGPAEHAAAVTAQAVFRGGQQRAATRQLVAQRQAAAQLLQRRVGSGPIYYRTRTNVHEPTAFVADQDRDVVLDATLMLDVATAGLHSSPEEAGWQRGPRGVAYLC